MTRLLVIRHGNTFHADETPRRVGCRTDIPLVESGIAQARALGTYLKNNDMIISHIMASALQRAQQTAAIMMREAGQDIIIHTDEKFNEIDHGSDENKTESEILERIGKHSLQQWDEFNIVPEGWTLNPREIQKSWISYANDCVKNRAGELSCVVSSGGIIRFAPILLDSNRLPNDQSPKVKTASLSLFEYRDDTWHCIYWNKRP
jgi:probable phosphoglycerate mutase